MTLPDQSPLTPEEQALAQRLGRLGPHAEPSPALDARVLAAAHAKAQVRDARPAAHRRGWPAMLGLAASLVLAVGLAWRLRPQAESPPAPRPRPVVALPVIARAPTILEPAPATAPTTSASPQEPSRKASVAAEPSEPETDSSAPERAAAVASPAKPSAKVVLDAPSPLAAAPPPLPPPPPRDLPADKVMHAVATPAPQAPPAAAAAQDSGAGVAANASTGTNTSEAAEANASSDLRAGDEPTDEVPPATAESPAVRDAWLQRIHGLVDAGDIAGARASLREFVRRYPDYPLPEDLRALAR